MNGDDTSLLWQPSASIAHLKARADMMTRIRAFFTKRKYLEVETPVMGRFGITDVYLRNIAATFREQTYCLQTSPEYHMKRLLASGSGPIFQLARVFRDDELGRWHNPEFTLLEWYQLHIDHHDLMQEMSDFLQDMLCCPPLQKITYQQAFEMACGIDPFISSIAEFHRVLQRYDLDNVLPEEEMDRDQYLFLLMSHVVEPFFAEDVRPVAIHGFPSSQAALAQVDDGVAHRFEVYFRGVELANGFHELTDASIQKARFIEDNRLRRSQQVPEAEPDAYLLQALEHGLPPCSGVALGVERLLALAWRENSIQNTLAFDFSRA